MKREQLEHILRACCAITRERDFVVIGSQSLLGSHPDAPDELLMSMEADVYPLKKPEASDLVDGAIGEASTFHETFGYYAHGVGPQTATLPRGWESRLIALGNENTGGATGWCLDPADLAVAKLVAGRPRDREFVAALFQHRLVEPAVVRTRLEDTDLAAEQKQQILQFLPPRAEETR